MPTVELSPLDRAIIAILQREGRTTYAQIGARVGVSATAAHERIKKLEARGVITGYHAGIDPELVGAGVTAFIFVSQKAGPRGALEELFAGLPWVEECHRVAGEESLLLKVRAESMPALEHLVWEIRALDTVERTKTMIVLATAFEGRPVEPATPESPLIR
jgi:Lrp/AsnC family leucine-responsive transcriptional regulator